MSRVLLTIESPGETLNLEEVKERLDLDDSELDLQFGVVPIDPAAGKYTILVDEAAASRIDGAGDWKVDGPFSDARIAAFGP